MFRDIHRSGRITWLAFLALWAVQVWRPQLAFPAQGVVQAGALGIALVLAALLWWRSRETAFHPGAWVGFGFAALMVVRWMFSGRPAMGADNVATVVLAAAAALAAYLLAGCLKQEGENPNTCMSELCLALSVVALACGLHAILEYAWLYDRSLRNLLEAIGGRPPTPVEEGLLYRLRIKRVASVWGDPNALGGFLALSFPAMLVCARQLIGRRSVLVGWLGAAAGAVSIVAILLTRSRGAILDLLVVLLLLAGLRMIRLRRLRVASLGIVAFLTVAATTSTVDTRNVGLLQRSGTIRERLHYAEIGVKIFRMNPVFGAGPGAVEMNYGRLKPEQARESKYLHNWVLQVGAETGLAGLALVTAFLLLVAWRLFRNGALLDPWTGALLAFFAGFVVDALMEHSFNQREMMLTFGLVSGLLLHAGATQPRYPRAIARGTLIVSVAFLALFIACEAIPRLLARHRLDSASWLIEAGEPAEAMKALRSARFWYPRDTAAYVSMAFLEEGLSGPNGAAMILEQALVIQPNSASLHARRAEALLKAGRAGEAERELRVALTLYPTKPEYHFGLAKVLEAQGDLPGALAHARRAAELEPLKPESFRQYVSTLEARQKNAN